MPFIQIIRGPRKNFSGVMAGIEFKNGKSLYNVSQREAHRVAASIGIKDAETGEIVSAISHGNSIRRLKADQLDKLNREAAIPGGTKLEPKVASAEAPDGDNIQPPAPNDSSELLSAVREKLVADAAEQANLWSYTREEIEALADKEGIGGLREFANARDVRGVSIPKIIDGLMAKLEARTKG